ncbi:endonuclease/exonuclease/phosphatase family protein [Streptomyces sporangiiformans]|uniref:Endonuclease/exonuclease/phosphatase family protein n=1 Tax=Streptomyces sporangiiformans TaxID=2315329 RepID=A0A505DB22_9ACTN|nr:endonuclease/exonuclease/phosphatase family protein [Streptomyces sporangiiformans]TPQ21703.1 endonuclease/exonuclease/phosphatase family protein [Streptomyces sporangiiformans]
MGSATAETYEWIDDDPATRRPGQRGGAWLAGLLLLGVSTVVGCRIADTDGITPVPQLLAFLPWLLAPTAAALLLAALTRWRLGLVWGVAALATIAWFIEPYGKTADAKGTPLVELRVLTSNVEFGQATDELIKAVRSERPDLVFVEECEALCEDKLRQAFGRKDTQDAQGTENAQDTYPYRQAVPGNGSDGSVILSRYPLKPAAGIPGAMGMPGATADVKGKEIRVQLAHPMPPLPAHLDDWREELGALRDYAAADRTRPTILAGDFNASQDHAAFRRILDTGLRDGARLAGHPRTPSWPARTAPALGAQIDHVLVSRDFSANSARFLDLDNTDHRSLVVDLTLHERA